ncbi:MAG: aspartate kinase [Candidatus Kapaibacteriota bacterium]
MGIKVLKFGGTSVANAYAMQNAFRIVQNNRDQKVIVVVSACAGITDRLVNLIDVCLSPDNKYKQILDEIENHHLRLIIDLFNSSEKSASSIKAINFIIQSLKQLLEGIRILEEITSKVKAEILSYGELISSNIFYNYTLFRGLNAYLLDARKVIETDNYHLNAQPDLTKIQQNGEKLLKLFNNYDVIITQGFIGNWKQETTVLGRGGSDLSASLFGYSVDAEEIQIWTDVDGIMTADPRIVTSAKVIEEITVDEVAELSFFGAKVLHPDTIKPAMIKNIPVRVLNTFNANGFGTKIVQNSILNTKTSCINSILLLEDCFLLSKKVANDAKDFVYFLDILQKNFEKVLKFTFNSNNILAISRNSRFANVENLLAQDGFDIQKVDAIAIFGLNISQLSSQETGKLGFIVDTIFDSLVNKFYFFVSDYSLLLLVKPNQGKEVIHFIHSILFE